MRHMPENDSEDDLPRRPGVPVLADALRLWRDAGARRHDETPGAILACAIECLKYVDVPDQAHIWITAARAVHDEGGLDDDTADCVMWTLAQVAESHSEDGGQDAPEFLRRAGADELVRLIARDVTAFENRMTLVAARMSVEFRAANEYQARGWAPPGVERARLRHAAFFEAVVATEDGSPERAAVTAGLLALRFYDHSLLAAEIVTPDSMVMTKTREEVACLPRDDPLRITLVRLLNRVQRTPQDGNEGVPGDLLAIAQAYRARGSSLLAADVCYTIVQGWGNMDDGALARPARRMLREIEREIAGL